ncbi:MAG: hypothetical protein ACOYMB_02965 [Patescibacteria group bacterium]
MENNQKEQTKEEISRKNRNFFVKAGATFLAIFIGILWLLNLSNVFQSSLKDIKNVPQEKTDFTQVRSDLDKIMTDVGVKFEKIKENQAEAQEAEVLLNKISDNASSSLLASSSLISSSSSPELSSSTIATTSIKILKK